MSKYGGWAGKMLRVNLTTGVITTEDTYKYKDYIGGMGIGYKVMWDEVPEGTKAFDEANKVIFGAGPLTGTGFSCSSRTNITSLMPVHNHLIGDSHMGGHFAAEMKYAGWDMIIIEGKASRPVWLRIEDDKVVIEDARRIWGKGTYDATAEICSIMGEESHVAVIGPAGENLVPNSIVLTGTCHSAGGHGGVLGSKNLKGIGIKGTQAVPIRGNRKDWLKLDKKIYSILGANNQHVVPSTPQPWAEYHSPRTRWTARKGLFWGAAPEPVETGECDPRDKNSVGLRTLTAEFYMGSPAAKYTVRNGGCQSCPIRCQNHMKIPQLKKYGYSENATNTCAVTSNAGYFLFKGYYKDESEPGEAALVSRFLGAKVADDLGVWCNYMQIGKVFEYAHSTGRLKKVLPEDEWNDIPWDKLDSGDPEFLIDIYHRIAYRKGEISHLGDGTLATAERWDFGDDFWHNPKYDLWSQLGFPKHHSNETAGQVGALLNCMFNRDVQCHSHVNFVANGLPIELQQEIASEIWGPGALDAPMNYTPVNESKVRFSVWSVLRNVLHDSLTLCNWMWPLHASPLKSRGYRGDTSLESKMFSLVTGHHVSEEELDRAGKRIFTLHRALTVKQMGTVDMRNEHDATVDWIYDMDPDQEAFTPGTVKMDREDMQLGLTMFYREMGWDEKTGAPTKRSLIDLGMPEVAKELEAKGLLPA